MDQAEITRGPSAGLVPDFDGHADRDSALTLGHRLQLPGRGANKPVGGRPGIVRLVAKPGKTDGYSPPDGAAVLPSRVFTDKQHLLGARRLPRGDVCAVQVHLAGDLLTLHAYLEQAAVAFDDPCDALDAKTAVKFHRCFFHEDPLTG